MTMNPEHEALAVKLTDCQWRSYEGSGDVVRRWAVEREEAAQAITDLSAERDALAAENAVMREATTRSTVSLIAAVSLLESGGKKAAGSDKMFAQMLKDYKASIEIGRAALNHAAEGK
jgi:hypothetical protein